MIGEIATLHKPFIAWLVKHGLLYIYHRPDKKSGIQKGHPDFTVLRTDGPDSLIEFKLPGKKLSPDQEKRCSELRKAGFPVRICFDLESAIAHVEMEFGDLSGGVEGHAPYSTVTTAREAEVANEATRNQGREGNKSCCVPAKVVHRPKLAKRGEDLSGPSMAVSGNQAPPAQNPFWIEHGRGIGDVVCARNQEGAVGFIRMASAIDKVNLPREERL